MRFISAARAGPSRKIRSPCAFAWVMGVPESKAALAARARVQFSARALAIFASSVFFFAASAASAWAFFSSNSLSLPVPGAFKVGLGAEGATVTAGAMVVLRGPSLAEPDAGRVGTGARLPPGCLRMFFSGISWGGARSLNTLRPSLSIHCHCAEAPSAQVQVTASKISWWIFMGVSLAN